MNQKFRDSVAGQSYLESQRYVRLLKKKVKDKPFPLQLIQRRTLNTAMAVLLRIREIDFEALTLSLYFYCRDNRYLAFVRRYQAQLELAKVDREKFIWGLHSFYMDISNTIRKTGAYQDFFDFMAACQERAQQAESPVEVSVFNSYRDLILQNLEYLRPDRTKLEQTVIGIKTDGSLMTFRDPYALLDLACYEFEDQIETLELAKWPGVIHAIHKNRGFEAWSLDDMEILQHTAQAFDNNHYDMLPYINEYTADIVPRSPLDQTGALILPAAQFPRPIEGQKELLRHRNGTLPANGAVIQLTGVGDVKQILMKEILHNGSIRLLYKFTTSRGEFAGSYNTANGYFYSIFTDSQLEEKKRQVMELVLPLYCSLVCKSPDFQPDRLEEYFPGISVKVFLHGGRLRNVYDPEATPIGRGTGKRDPEKYETEERTLNGMIRNLPEGQVASESAREAARLLGYELEPGQTYVQAFQKRVWLLKDKNREEKNIG